MWYFPYQHFQQESSLLRIYDLFYCWWMHWSLFFKLHKHTVCKHIWFVHFVAEAPWDPWECFLMCLLTSWWIGIELRSFFGPSRAAPALLLCCVEKMTATIFRCVRWLCSLQRCQVVCFLPEGVGRWCVGTVGCLCLELEVCVCCAHWAGVCHSGFCFYMCLMKVDLVALQG